MKARPEKMRAVAKFHLPENSFSESWVLPASPEVLLKSCRHVLKGSPLYCYPNCPLQRQLIYRFTTACFLLP